MAMAPKTEVKERHPESGARAKILYPIPVFYARIMDTFTEKDTSTEPERRMIRAHRKRLFGADVISESTQLYNDMSMLRNLNIPLPTWEEYDIHTKAKMIAQYNLRNMVETIERHLDIMDENKKKVKK